MEKLSSLMVRRLFGSVMGGGAVWTNPNRAPMNVLKGKKFPENKMRGEQYKKYPKTAVTNARKYEKPGYSTSQSRRPYRDFDDEQPKMYAKYRNLSNDTSDKKKMFVKRNDYPEFNDEGRQDVDDFNVEEMDHGRERFRPSERHKDKNLSQNSNYPKRHEDAHTAPAPFRLNRWKHLAASKGYRLKQNSLLVAGLPALQHAPVDKIRSVMVASREGLSKLKEVFDLPKDVNVEITDAEQFAVVTGENNPHGVVAEVVLPTIHSFPEAVILSAAKQAVGSPQRWLGVCGLRDGANLGLLIRAVGCLDWTGVVIIGSGCVDPFGLPVVRSSAGAIFRVPLARAASFDELVKNEMQIVLAEVPDKAKDTGALVDNNKSLVLVVGSEQSGLPKDIPSQAIYRSIPINPEFGSLNAALAGSILMHQLGQIE